MISVVIPTFNEEENIAQCLVSLRHQTVPRSEYEIIIVDGGSKDRTREIAGKYADKVFIQTSRKVGGARNDGIMAATGDIVATTDADCIIPPIWIETITKGFDEKNVVLLYGPVYPIEESLKNSCSLFFCQHIFPSWILYEGFLLHPWMQHCVLSGCSDPGRNVPEH